MCIILLQRKQTEFEGHMLDREGESESEACILTTSK